MSDTENIWFGIVRWSVEDVIAAAAHNGVELSEDQALIWWRENESAFKNLIMEYGNEVLYCMNYSAISSHAN